MNMSQMIGIDRKAKCHYVSIQILTTVVTKKEELRSEFIPWHALKEVCTAIRLLYG